MWCRRCQQEVPGIVCHDDSVAHEAASSHDPGRYCCPRCGEPLGDRRRHEPQQTSVAEFAEQRAAQPTAATVGWVVESSSPPTVIQLPQMAVRPALDNWETDEQLRHIGRILAVEELEVARPEVLRIDAAHSHGVAGKHPRDAAAADETPAREGQGPADGAEPRAAPLLDLVLDALGDDGYHVRRRAVGLVVVERSGRTWADRRADRVGRPGRPGGRPAPATGPILAGSPASRPTVPADGRSDLSVRRTDVLVRR